MPTLYVCYKRLVNYGNKVHILDPASGGSEDWAKESAAIKFVYLLELRPDEKSNHLIIYI